MTATTASTTADRISQPARDPRLATALRLIALVLGLLAAAAGVAYVFGTEVPKPQGWQNQVLTVIWLMPILAVGGGILGQFYPRTGAALLGVAGVLGLVLALTAAGFPSYLAALILLALVASAACLFSIQVGGDNIWNWHVVDGELVRPDWLTRFAAAKIASAPMFLVVIGAFIGCSIWTIVFSFTRSAALPTYNFIGWAQYDRLFHTARWTISVENLAVYIINPQWSAASSFIVLFAFILFRPHGLFGKAAFR